MPINVATTRSLYRFIARWLTTAMLTRRRASALCTTAAKDAGRDYAKALKWYRRAADQGDADAQNNVGEMYHDGLGVWARSTPRR